MITQSFAGPSHPDIAFVLTWWVMLIVIKMWSK